MIRFLNKIVLYFLLLGILAGLYLLTIYFRPDLVDNFYIKFTTEKANSMIIGTSRSAQGIMPSIINDRICNDNNAIINHSFAIGPSSFGPNYYKEIIGKLKENTSNGIYILSVDPWSLATESTNVNDDSLKFFEIERKLFVGNLSSSSENPNFDYLYNYWNNRFLPFGNGFKHLINYEGLLVPHPDGWLEVNITMDSILLNNRINRSTEEYRARNMYLSQTRLNYFEKIIKYLKPKGKIFFVRLPVSAGMAEIEHEYFPEFNEAIIELAERHQIPYFNFIGESGKHQTIDTHHLHRIESVKITHRICDSISSYLY